MSVPVSADTRLWTLSALLSGEKIDELAAKIDRLCADLAVPTDQIDVAYVTSISPFGEDDVDVKTGNHRVKVWLRVYPRPGVMDLYVWLRLSRELGDEDGPFTLDREQITHK